MTEVSELADRAMEDCNRIDTMSAEWANPAHAEHQPGDSMLVKRVRALVWMYHRAHAQGYEQAREDAAREAERFCLFVDDGVGDYIAPPGGPDVRAELDRLIFCANHRTMDAHTLHIEYEMLHPFMDGNGRSGRLLWLWMREGRAPIGFLHRFYYDTLSRAQR